MGHLVEKRPGNSSPGPERPGQGQHSNEFRAAATQYSRAFLDRGAGRQHVIDDDDPLPFDAAAAAHREGAAHIARAADGAEPLVCAVAFSANATQAMLPAVFRN